MKAISVLGIFAGLVGSIAFGEPLARAQSEIDPDHFESSNVEPFEKSKTDASSEGRTIRYDGNFRLPYTVQCNGKSLRPGKYSISLRSDGKVGRATLNQEGQAMGIGGVVHKQAHKRRSDAILIEFQDKARRLSAIRVADFVFEPQPQLETASDSKPRRFQKLPLMETAQKR